MQELVEVVVYATEKMSQEDELTDLINLTQSLKSDSEEGCDNEK